MSAQFKRALALFGAASLIATLLAGFFATTANASETSPVTTTMTWNQQTGADKADPGCIQGQSSYWHWILTPAGKNELVSATLAVDYKSGATTSTSGTFRGGGSGAMHFDVTRPSADVVKAASVSFTYLGEGGNFVLTISDSGCHGTPDKPKDKVVYSEWKDGDKSCESKTVTQTRTKSVTTYVWDEEKGKWVEGTTTTTTETRTRPMTSDEVKECNVVIGTPSYNPNKGSCTVRTPSVTVTVPFPVRGIGYQIKGHDNVWPSSLENQPAGTYTVTLPSIAAEGSVVYRVAIQASAEPEPFYSEWFTFTAGSDCGENPPPPPPVKYCPNGTVWTDTNGNGKMDECEKTPATPTTPTTPTTPKPAIHTGNGPSAPAGDTGLEETMSASEGNFASGIFTIAAGLALFVLTVLIMSRRAGAHRR